MRKLAANNLCSILHMLTHLQTGAQKYTCQNKMGRGWEGLGEKMNALLEWGRFEEVVNR